MERILEQCNPLCLSCECGDSSITAQSQKERPGRGLPAMHPGRSAFMTEHPARTARRSEKKRGRQMVQSTQPPERSSFPLTLDGSTPEELLKAGKYDWVADYSRQIVHSKVYAVTEAGNASKQASNNRPQRPSPPSNRAT